MTRLENQATVAHARFVQRVRRRYATESALLPSGLPGKAAIASLASSMESAGHEPGHVLRITRQLILERLATLDCEERSTVEDVTASMTALAEFSLDRAFALSYTALTAQYGTPLSTSGTAAQLLVVGMGKLGARELNVSSDIDLIYVYDQDGETTGDSVGRGRISNQEFFAKMVRGIYALIGDSTDHGFVFRVDLASTERQFRACSGVAERT